MSDPLRVLYAGKKSDAAQFERYLGSVNLDVELEDADNVSEFCTKIESADYEFVVTSDSATGFGVVEAISIMRHRGGRTPILVATIGNDGAFLTKSVDPNTGVVSVEGSGMDILSVFSERQQNSPLFNKDHLQIENDYDHLLLDIIKSGRESSTLAEFLFHTHMFVRKILDVEDCLVLLRNRLTGQLTTGFCTDTLRAEPASTAAIKRLASRLIRTGVPVVWSRNRNNEDEKVEGLEQNWATVIGIPLKTAVRPIGALTLVSSKGFSIESAQMKFLARVAEQVSINVEKRRAEDALRESEGRYRMLFDHAPDGIVIADANGKPLDANQGFCRSLGYDHDEFFRLNVQQIVAPSEIPHIAESLREIAEKSEHHREWKFVRKDGSQFVADVSSTKMPDGNILAIVRDLSESRKSEMEKAVLAAEVEVQRERLKNIVARVPGVVWESAFDPGTKDQIGSFVSDYITEMLGYSVSEWLTKPNFWASIVHPNCPRKREAAATFAADGRFTLEIQLVAKSGKVVWVEAHTTAILGSKGNIEGTRGVMIDITERKRSENALRESEERYRELVENAIDIVYVNDLEGNCISVNKAAERITGYTRDELLGMNLTDLAAPEQVEKAREMIRVKLAGREIMAYEIEIIAKNGRRVMLEVNPRLVYDNGVPVAIEGIARDTTERHLLEEKYRQSQKLEAVGLLAGGIAHDFNNLLTAITGYSEITLERMSPEDPLRHNIEEIKAIGERASALTQQLLAFSRKQVLKPVVHNVNSVIRNMDRMLRRLVRENIEFHIDLSPELGNVETDPGQLEQVIVNLAINAQDAMPHGGKLTISTENIQFGHDEDNEISKLGIGPFVKMTVADTGDGIDESIQDRIFEPFFTTKDSSKGSGLGLSTVHGIVKQSGGEILLHSEKGKGATFEIYFPAAADDQNVREWTPTRTADYTGNETVLLVEDDRSVRNLVREVLLNSGYEVLEAESGQSALEICGDRREPIHMLLTDLVMPQMSGIELTTKVRSMHPEAKPLVMTGYASDSPIRGSMSNFDATFIEKPFTPESLARKVREVLES